MSTLGDDAENTLIIFTSDHGEMLGAHGKREKNNFYEGMKDDDRNASIAATALPIDFVILTAQFLRPQSRRVFLYSSHGLERSFPTQRLRRKSAIWM